MMDTRMSAAAGVTSPRLIPAVEVRVDDDFDAASAQRFAVLLSEAMILRPEQLTVDLSRCETLDAAGIAVLLDIHRRIRRDGGYLTLRGLSERLWRNLRLAHADRVLHVVADGNPP